MLTGVSLGKGFCKIQRGSSAPDVLVKIEAAEDHRNGLVLAMYCHARPVILHPQNSVCYSLSLPCTGFTLWI